MAGGSTTGTTGSFGGGTSASTPNPVNQVTGYASRPSIDPFSGYAPPSAPLPPASPRTFQNTFGFGAMRYSPEREYQNRLEAQRTAQARQDAEIAASRRQVEQNLYPIFGGYRSARQAPSSFRGQFSSPFSYTQPQPSYFEPQPINPFAMQPRSQTQQYDIMPGGGLASLFSGFYR